MSLHLYLRKYLRSYPQWQFHPPHIQAVRQLENIGSAYGGYFIDTSMLVADPVIYSLGVGEDISFDLALIERHGYIVHAFDPTPKVRAWIESQSLPDEFKFHAIGIADFDGEADFYLPPRQNYISHSMIRARQYGESSIRVPVAKLSAEMARLGHTRIDLLKMDIEGAEYAVLTEIIQKKLEVQQIVVEFHHRLSGIGVAKTREILASLYNYGMRLCYLCPRMEVMTLIHEAY